MTSKRRARILRTIGLSLVFLVMIGVTGCLEFMQFRWSKDTIEEKFAQYPHSWGMETDNSSGREIFYVHAGNPKGPMILFIHGAPGSFNAFEAFLLDSALGEEAFMVSVDRPGYGYSSFGESLVSIDEQAKALVPLLQLNPMQERGVMVVGHSYGCAIGARLATLAPDQVSALLMVAPVIDPENEKYFWVNKPANSPLIKWMLPKAMRVSNDEKLAHAQALKDVEFMWEELETPTMLMHGEKDNIAPFINASYGQRMIKNAPLKAVLPADENHLIPFQNPKLVFDEIYYYLKQGQK